MTELKCGICGHKLACDEQKSDKLVEVLYCPVCKDYMLGNFRIWERLANEHRALMITAKQLEIAIATLHEIDAACEDNKYTDNLYVGLDEHDTRNIANDVKQALAEIKK